MQGGVVYSNKVIIMSSVHTKGHIISALGHGLEPTLAIHKYVLLFKNYEQLVPTFKTLQHYFPNHHYASYPVHFHRS